MGVKFKLTKKAKQTLGLGLQGGRITSDIAKSIIVDKVREEFSKSAPKEIRKALLRDVTKGISPVEGFGKFKKYSESYKDVIAGKGMYRQVGGKTVFFEGVRDEALLSAASPKKKRSPVSLRLTGQLHNALKLFTTGGFTDKFRLVFDWRDFLADIHNRRGAGKSRAVRRMLPTSAGEEFNRSINETILDRLKRAAFKVAKRFS